MSEIPADIIKTAHQIWIDALKDGTPDAAYIIGAAILVERKRADSLKAMCDEMAKALEPFARIRPVSISLADNHISSDAFRSSAMALARYRKEKEVGNG